MVAAHIIVIGIIGSKIDGVKEVGAIGLRRYKQLNIESLVGCLVILQCRICIGGLASTIGRHIESVYLIRCEILIDRNGAYGKITLWIILFNRSLLHTHLLRHIVDDHTCDFQSLGSIGSDVFETDLSHHTCKVDIDGKQIGLLAYGLLYVTLHKQVFILAHLHIILGEGVFVANELLHCGKVLSLCPIGVAGVGKDIDVAVLPLGKTDVELADLGGGNLVIARGYELVADRVELEHPDVLDGLLGCLLRISRGAGITVGPRHDVVDKGLADYRRSIGVQTQRHFNGGSAVTGKNHAGIGIIRKPVITT